MNNFICTATCVGELEGVHHARVTINHERAQILLALHPLINQSMEVLGGNFLRIESADYDCLCLFGECISNDDDEPLELPRDDDWFVEPNGLAFDQARRDFVVMRISKDGIEWKLCPKYADENPLSAEMTWGDIRKLANGECPFGRP